MGGRKVAAAAVIALALGTGPGCSSLGGPVATGAILGGAIGAGLGMAASNGSDFFDEGRSTATFAVLGVGIGVLLGGLFGIIEEQDAGPEYAGPDPNEWRPPPMASGVRPE